MAQPLATTWVQLSLLSSQASSVQLRASAHGLAAPTQVAATQVSVAVQKRPSSHAAPSLGVQALASTLALQRSHGLLGFTCASA
jgi:hypothetical protein